VKLLDRAIETRRRRTIAAAVMWLAPTLGCAAGRAPAADQLARRPTDEIRAAVLRMITDSTPGRLLVDPLPFPGPKRAGRGSVVPTSDDIGSGDGLEQLGAIADVALRAAPDSVRRYCAGVLVPPISPATHAGCPREPYTVIVIGEPSAMPGARADSLQRALPALDHASPLHLVEVAETSVSAAGRSTEVWEYMAALRHGAWAVVARRAVLILE
jgi:hypothetical protein